MALSKKLRKVLGKSLAKLKSITSAKIGLFGERRKFEKLCDLAAGL